LRERFVLLRLGSRWGAFLFLSLTAPDRLYAAGFDIALDVRPAIDDRAVSKPVIWYCATGAQIFLFPLV
jgi:hypothetical protein